MGTLLSEGAEVQILSGTSDSGPWFADIADGGLFLHIIYTKNGKAEKSMQETRTIEFKETITKYFLKNSECLFKLQWGKDFLRN